MSKYIKVDKLITEIERWEIILDKYKDSFEEAACCKQELVWMKDYILSLQQERVDLEKAVRHVYESWMGGTMDDVRRDMVEPGKVLNARKEENK